jgi:predicted ester cyclase
MTTEQTKQFMEDYGQILSGAIYPTPEVLDKYISDVDMELKQHIQVFQTGIPGYILEQNDLIVTGNKAVLSFTLKGIHKGELFGAQPTGNEVNVPGIIIYEVEDFKIVKHHMVADTMVLMTQIGALAVPEEVEA